MHTIHTSECKPESVKPIQTGSRIVWDYFERIRVIAKSIVLSLLNDLHICLKIWIIIIFLHTRCLSHFDNNLFMIVVSIHFDYCLLYQCIDPNHHIVTPLHASQQFSFSITVLWTHDICRPHVSCAFLQAIIST